MLKQIAIASKKIYKMGKIILIPQLRLKNQTPPPTLNNRHYAPPNSIVFLKCLFYPQSYQP